MGLSTISPRIQRSFSAWRNDHAVNWSPENKSKKTAAGAPASRKARSAEAGEAAGIAAVASPPERRSHEGKQQLELVPSAEKGDVKASPFARSMKWLP